VLFKAVCFNLYILLVVHGHTMPEIIIEVKTPAPGRGSLAA
jgi:hypothetical protein